METICGACCENCGLQEACGGCASTGGRPFGGACVAAEYIKAGGKEAYDTFKKGLLAEVNALLNTLGIPEADGLYEIPGFQINLEYAIPSGRTVKMLDDRKVYLGCQIEFADLGVCYGVAADAGFLLVCSYSVNGSEPELVVYKKR